MSESAQKQIEEAFKILNRYDRALTEKIAAEIVEKKEDFENPIIGGAEELVEKHYRLLAYLCRIRSNLYAYLPVEKKHRPLTKDEFRCFRCYSIIRMDEDACPQCGWTWG